MRKIEHKMLTAVKNRLDMIEGNTGVFYINEANPHGPRSEIYLHNNHIASYWYQDETLEVNTRTLQDWPTATTKSRLRALGAKVTTVKGETYLDGERV